jgi:DNA-binding Lrp family transcriptional regulator
MPATASKQNRTFSQKDRKSWLDRQSIQAKCQVMDKIDRHLISILRIEGRASVSKLAAMAKVSRGTVQNRLERLQRGGAIVGFTVRVRDTPLNGSLRAIMLVEVSGKTTTAIGRLRGIPELRFLHTTNGAWDLVAEIQADSLSDFDRVLREVRMIDGVLNTQTSILLTSI